MIHNIRVHGPWVYSDGLDRRIRPGHLSRIDDIRQFALTILLLAGETCLCVLETVEGYASSRRPNMCGAGEKYNPDILRRLGCSSEERGQKELDEQGVAEMVDSKLHIVALCGQAWGSCADRGVADEKIEARRQ